MSNRDSHPIVVHLQKAVKGAGISQGELARRCSMNPEYVSKIANGHITPLVSTALRIAQALGCSIEDLFELVDEEAA